MLIFNSFLSPDRIYPALAPFYAMTWVKSTGPEDSLDTGWVPLDSCRYWERNACIRGLWFGITLGSR